MSQPHRLLPLRLFALAVAVTAFVALGAFVRQAPAVEAAPANRCESQLKALTRSGRADPAKIKAAYDCLRAQRPASSIAAPPVPAKPVASFITAAFGCVVFSTGVFPTAVDATGTYDSTGGPSGRVSGTYGGEPYGFSSFDVNIDGVPNGFGITVGPLIFFVTFNPHIVSYAGFIWPCELPSPV